jgi:hypothetical protein
VFFNDHILWGETVRATNLFLSQSHRHLKFKIKGQKKKKKPKQTTKPKKQTNQQNPRTKTDPLLPSWILKHQEFFCNSVLSGSTANCMSGCACMHIWSACAGCICQHRMHARSVRCSHSELRRVCSAEHTTTLEKKSWTQFVHSSWSSIKPAFVDLQTCRTLFFFSFLVLFW